MKKNLFFLGALLVGMTTLVACGDDDNNKSTDNTREQEMEIINQIDADDNVDYTSSNATAWGNYMRAVGALLVQDATTLYYDWSRSYRNGASYGNQFKNHTIASLGTTALPYIEQIIDGMADIANEVGESKIGDPLSKYMTNFPSYSNMREGLYAVESWYSWHSRDDYSNNILSIRNGYYGVYEKSLKLAAPTPAQNSMYTVVNSINPTLNKRVTDAINNAIAAIQAIPQPFRNNINTTESRTAQTACATLQQILSQDLKNFFETSASDDATLDPVIANIVDVVIIPTSRDLMNLNTAMQADIVSFQSNPTTAGFTKLGQDWIAARQPWESFEAFLFGPVSDDGLDPNMDSWPLDRDGIVSLLGSQQWNEMNWTGEFNEDDEKIAAAQGLRGFHTLEFLIFKNGQTRTVQ